MKQEDLTEFKNQLRGDLIEPTDATYEEARKVYNAMISRKPRLIAKCADVADVITAVNFGRKNNLLVSVRSGGHNAGGLGICDDGLVIDLFWIKYVYVDPVAKTVRVEIERTNSSTVLRVTLRKEKGRQYSLPFSLCGFSKSYLTNVPVRLHRVFLKKSTMIPIPGPLLGALSS